jgi:hypothetical protein
MTNETSISIFPIASLVLCCAAPIAPLLLGSGAVLSALGAVWVDVRTLLLGICLLLAIIGIMVLVLAKRVRGPEQVHPNTTPAAWR